MAPRRANGEGLKPIQREGRKGWWSRVRLSDPETGETRRVWVKGATPTEVVKNVRKLVNDTEVGRMPRADAGMSVADYAEVWVRDHLPARDITENSKRQYKHAVNNLVVPTIGAVQLSKLRAIHAEQMDTKLARGGKSKSSRRSAYNILKSMCDTAVRDKVIAANPVVQAKRPTDTPRQQPRYSIAQLDDLLVAVREQEMLENLVPLLAWTGMRVGEALALRWEDIDLDASSPTLWLAATNVQDTHGKIVRQPFTKSKTVRQVPLLPDAIAALRAERKAQAERRLAAGAAWEDNGLVFCDGLGRLIDDRNLRRRYAPIVAGVGLTGSFHALRRSTATLLTASRSPLNVVSAILGHSSTAVTQERYAVVETGMMEQALKELAVFVAAQRSRRAEQAGS